MLETLITSKTRIRLLTKFFVNSDNDGYLRGVSEKFIEATRTFLREFYKLKEAGYLKTDSRQHIITCRANTGHLLFSAVKRIIHQHLNLEALVVMLLGHLENVERVVLLGDDTKDLGRGTIVLVIDGEINYNHQIYKHLVIE